MTSHRTRRTGFVLLGIALALLLAGVASHYASARPDGLARVAIDKGLDRHERTSGTQRSPLAGYSVHRVPDPRLSRGLAGVAGVSLTFLVAGAVMLAVGRGAGGDEGTRRSRPPR